MGFAAFHPTYKICDRTNLIGDNNCGGLDGQENPCDFWWGQVKYYATLAMSRVGRGLDSVKEFLSTLTPDERWGVLVVFEEVQPVMFDQLVAIF
ncbi:MULTISPECIES: hypothetical protein [Nostocaceae]|uniref:Uncharacterized protein n=1 Tax=Trichormus variabilis NIES-23 TaxID=1973479 RepID=A0A1Z4KFQ2_ANAVA|nr:MULTISPECIES: hypothetical protein [Nostocaceae]BAY67757.1 hypothetical protein NIES23_05390 [Trichormus variabilis NIES-23]